jgi:hypothetical protein
MIATLDHIVASTDARATGQDKFMGHCLSHGSKRNRDLSIKLADDRIVVHCFAGCEPADVCQSMGLHLRDLFLGSKKDPAEIRREQTQRERTRAQQEAARKYEGLKVDARREADALIQSRTGLDIASWAPSRLDDELAALATAYAILWEEGACDR